MRSSAHGHSQPKRKAPWSVPRLRGSVRLERYRARQQKGVRHDAALFTTASPARRAPQKAYSAEETFHGRRPSHRRFISLPLQPTL